MTSSSSVDPRYALRQALLSAYGEYFERSVEDGRIRLVQDGLVFADREAPAIAAIRAFLQENLVKTDIDWLGFMESETDNPVVGFSSEDLPSYSDPNRAARDFIFENVYCVLFPQDAFSMKSALMG